VGVRGAGGLDDALRLRGHGYQHAVAESDPPNKFGLYNTNGGVYEWVEDAWHPDYVGAPDDGSVWHGDNSSKRVLRDGPSGEEPLHRRTSVRGYMGADHRTSAVVGFRIARTL
jgi:formylglycine-generating enzyme required for sulfatase activity